MSEQRPSGPPHGQHQYGQHRYGQPAGPGPYASAPVGPAYPPYPGLAPTAPAPYPVGRPPLPPGISRASYGWVWGVAGVLALSVLALSLVAVVGLGVLLITGGPQTYGDDPRLDALYDACERGSMRACDRLFEESPLFSEYEEFGLSCGGRNGLAMTCTGSEL